MEKIFDKMQNTLNHLEILHKIFTTKDNFDNTNIFSFEIYKKNEELLNSALDKLGFCSQLYNCKGRQMILADFIEYIFLGRGYYAIKKDVGEDKENFIRAILYFVNLLICYEEMTVSESLRKQYLQELAEKDKNIAKEDKYNELINFNGKVGLSRDESDAPKELDKYFDSFLPKTAGGLWHELLVYIFLLRNDIGYVIPLLLHQKILSGKKHIVPPDFLLITYDKDLYGIEVGTKKEIQSGTFSLQTNIPTATIDTINSRVSDRCPICKRWIPFCDFVINNFYNFDKDINRSEIKCLDQCNLYSEEEIVSGKCPYTKYSRNKTKTLEYTKHDFSNGLHYHYRCVLNNLDDNTKNKLINAKDNVALKTHYPYYAGIAELLTKIKRNNSN
ncbi:MAG: hypothetical protein PHT06_04465 [Dehalococcoidales bacterium]|nr:hypothetical protein [Dehalococcoidales bacterium]